MKPHELKKGTKHGEKEGGKRRMIKNKSKKEGQ
jgi:hypothetical protein